MVLGPSRTIQSGQYATLGAYLDRPAEVVLQRYERSSWRRLGTRVADRHGRAFFRVSPGRTSDFRIVATTKHPAVSRIAQIRVAQLRRGLAVVAEASRYRGTPYRYGGASPRGFDCSGFTQYVYGKFGRRLPHSATGQARYGRRIPKSAALPGDLVLFGRGRRYTHAAIYAGRGYMWDASTYGRPVALRRIYSSAYTIRRVI